MADIKNIIFDLGGVLVDWNPRYVFDPYFSNTQRCNFFLENICNDEWRLATDCGKPFRQAVEERSAEYPEWATPISLFAEKWKSMLGPQISGMAELITDLKLKHYHVYGLTNWSDETFPYARFQYKIFDLLEGIVISGEERMVKPDPRIYTLLLDRYNLKAEESLFVDDSEKNVLGAENVGMKAILFSDAGKLRRDLNNRFDIPV